jgi:hypothetical protein
MGFPCLRIIYLKKSYTKNRFIENDCGGCLPRYKFSISQILYLRKSEQKTYIWESPIVKSLAGHGFSKAAKGSHNLLVVLRLWQLGRTWGAPFISVTPDGHWEISLLLCGLTFTCPLICVCLHNHPNIIIPVKQCKIKIFNK